MKNTVTLKTTAFIIAAFLAFPTFMITGCTDNSKTNIKGDTLMTETQIPETSADKTITSEETTHTAADTTPVTEEAAVKSMQNVLNADNYQTDLEAYARKLLAQTREQITNESRAVAYEYLGKKQISYLWPFSVLLEATSALYECDTSDSELRAYYIKCLDEFLPRYLSPSNKKYRSYASSITDGTRYYDDNEWIVMEFVRAYELLGDEKYLIYAKELAEYCYSGWVESSGGVRWVEGGDSCNTCSNGPAAALSCMLYEATEDKYYLDWAVKIYSWTHDNLMDADGTYYDNIKITSGNVDKAKFSYNTGTMIVSGVKLYKLTGDKTYLEQARLSASGGCELFIVKAGGRYIVKNNHPWFNSWLLEGFIELFKADTVEGFTTDYIDKFYAVLENAAAKAGDGEFVGKSWNGKADDEVELIHQSGTVRAMAQLAKLIKEYT